MMDLISEHSSSSFLGFRAETDEPGLSLDEALRECQMLQGETSSSPGKPTDSIEETRRIVREARLIRLKRFILADYYGRHPDEADQKIREIIAANPAKEMASISPLEKQDVAEGSRVAVDDAPTLIERLPIQTPLYRIVNNNDGRPVRIAFNSGVLEDFDMLLKVIPDNNY
jgi:hypothetical protein